MLEAALPTLEVLRLPVQDRLERMETTLRGLVTADFGPINEVSDYLFSVRGKYLRPTLLLIANEVGGQPDEDAVRMAAIVELMHVATLVHDDSVDHSPKRRGMPTVNALWTHQVAVIMGDYLYSRALLEVTRTGNSEADEYYSLCDCKTASLMSAACELGALVGRQEYRKPLAAYGKDLGMAFQIIDDLIDYTVSTDITGKPSGLDLKEHKVTLPLIAALPKMDASARSAVDDLFADPEPSDDRVRVVGDAVRDVGGLEYARDKAAGFARSAGAHLDAIPEDPFVRVLRLIVDFVLERQR